MREGISVAPGIISIYTSICKFEIKWVEICIGCPMFEEYDNPKIE